METELTLNAESRNGGSLVGDVLADADEKLLPEPENKMLIAASVAKKNLICVFSAGVGASFTTGMLRGEGVGVVANAIVTLVDVDEV